MPEFDTPEPIAATIELAWGTARILATDAARTTVDVRPTDAATKADVTTAENTDVSFAAGTLQVKGPKSRGLFTKPGSVEITVELPAGSSLNGQAGAGSFATEGRLGDTRIKTAMGSIDVDETGALKADTAGGRVTARHIAGNAEVSTGTGEVELHRIDGTAVVKNSNGATRLGEVGGALRLKAANGDITVQRSLADVEARTANGSVRIDEIVRGSVQLATSLGDLRIGIRPGTTAWLDLDAKHGRVHNNMDHADEPDPDAETAEVHARTGFGDVTVRRTEMVR
ncbi:DUF4097 family beta strand repeat-containing protein [Saccharopolyspora sp. NPDC049357]|uniref:DUF4097 family beta strand repeat-containing protein n=1 Tax=Saccharopolyspora sp. NPDC049357 TaxID=3154507 RepID=UPI00342E9560